MDVSSLTNCKLRPKHKRFADEYLVDLNAESAYLRAGYCKSNSSNARKLASNLMANIHIRAYIETQLEKRSEVAMYDSAYVLDGLKAVYNRSMQVTPVMYFDIKKGKLDIKKDLEGNQVGTGTNNTICSNQSSVIIGCNNSVFSNFSTINNGINNVIYGCSFNSISNGSNNCIDSIIPICSCNSYNLIGSGSNNFIRSNGNYNSINSGDQNCIFTVSGYQQYNNIFNGCLNTILSDRFNTIINGFFNEVNNYGYNNTIINGYKNIILGDNYNFLLGGACNTICTGSSYSFLGAGQKNCIMGSYSMYVVKRKCTNVNGEFL